MNDLILKQESKTKQLFERTFNFLLKSIQINELKEKSCIFLVVEAVVILLYEYFLTIINNHDLKKKLCIVQPLSSTYEIIIDDAYLV